MAEGTSALFEKEIELPDAGLTAFSQRLVGFKPRYERVQSDLKLLIDSEGIEAWSRKHYQKSIAILQSLRERYPLIVFYGDVGTGKTATAEALSNAIAKDMGKEATLFKLSTRVRGSGQVGEMSFLINQAFDVVTKEAGKSRLAFLVIDEADSLASMRSQKQSHHEDKVAVNTLIQKIDDVRKLNGRVVVFMCTNRFETIDPAILRRAAFVEEFKRPNPTERQELFQMDCADLGLGEAAIIELVNLTEPKGSEPGFTYSDIRTKILPEAVSAAYPSRRIEMDDLKQAVRRTKPSPSIYAGSEA